MSTAIFEIFRAGKHNGTGGNECKRTWSKDDIAKIGLFYNENIKSAPLVIGHPENNEPQLGKVKRLIHHENALFAEAEINTELIHKIKDGGISGISASFYPKDSTKNPIKGLGFYLRHVGFLEKGKQAPAVKGMLDPKNSIECLMYSEVEENTILFCEEDLSLSYAEQLHEKVLYFTNVLDVEYETALQIINQQ